MTLCLASQSLPRGGGVCVSLGLARNLLWTRKAQWQNINTMTKATGAETFVNPAPEGFIEEGKDIPLEQTQLLF